MIKQGHSDQKILPAQLRQPSHQFINPSSFPSFLIPRPPLGTLLAAHSPPLNPKASAPAISSSTYPPQPTFLFRRPTKTRRKTSLTEKTALLRLFKGSLRFPHCWTEWLNTCIPYADFHSRRQYLPQQRTEKDDRPTAGHESPPSPSE